MLDHDGIEDPMTSMQDFGLLTLAIQEVGDPMLTILEVDIQTLRLGESGITDWRYHVVGHPLWSLREVVFPSLRLHKVEGEMVSCLILLERSGSH